MKHLTIIFLLIILFTSCSGDNDSSTDINTPTKNKVLNDEIIGTWKRDYIGADKSKRTEYYVFTSNFEFKVYTKLGGELINSTYFKGYTLNSFSIYRDDWGTYNPDYPNRALYCYYVRKGDVMYISSSLDAIEKESLLTKYTKTNKHF